MPCRPAASSCVLAGAALLAFLTAAAIPLGAQRASQGVVVPTDPLWAAAQDTPQEPAPPAGDAAPDAAGRGRGAAPNPPPPRPYDQVITKDARTDDGVFKVHRIGEQLFYEIPKAELGREFLWVTQIKRNAAGRLGGEAAGNRVVRWDLVGNRVLLR